MRERIRLSRVATAGMLLAGLIVAPERAGSVAAQGPTLVDPNLDVRPLVGGLTTPVSIAFLGADDLLVLEKNTGRIQRIVGGAVQSTVLDLAVNFASERGLLGIALHPDFPADRGVYL